MTISERRTFVGIPTERTDMAPHDMSPVTAQDTYGEFGANRRVGGILEVLSEDVISLRGENRFSNHHYYSKEEINKLKIEKRNGNRNPLIKEKIVWSKE